MPLGVIQDEPLDPADVPLFGSVAEVARAFGCVRQPAFMLHISNLYLTHIPHSALVETIRYAQDDHDIQRHAALYPQLHAV
jgi:hypothetical protein